MGNKLQKPSTWIKLVLLSGISAVVLFFEIYWMDFWTDIILTKEEIDSNKGIEPLLTVLPIILTVLLTIYMGYLLFFFKEED